MKKMLFAAILGSLVFSSSLMAAEGSSYFGVGYHMGTYKETGFPSASPTALGIRGGIYLTNEVAIEGRYAFGLSDDTVNVFIPGPGYVDIDLELESALSVFVKVDVPVSPTVRLYPLLGFTDASIKASVPGTGISVSDSDSGLSYGFGVEFSAGEGMYLGGEYIMYIDESAYDYTGINIGFSRLF